MNHPITVRRLTQTLLGLWLTALIFSPASAFAFDGEWDIFDNHTKTRRLADKTETEMTLQVGGCSGFLIGPTIGMSAAHCRDQGDKIPVVSGPALVRGGEPDGVVLKDMELGSIETYDVWIFKIKWNSPKFPKGIRLIPYIWTQRQQLRVGENRVSDLLFSLGFPADVSHGRVIMSMGYGKTDGRTRLMKNNISLINGNSGGAILRKKDLLLVSVVSGGPHMYGQPGWEDNDWDDPTHWNWGPPMWQVYPKSRVLQALFPKGTENVYYQLKKKKDQERRQQQWSNEWGTEIPSIHLNPEDDYSEIDQQIDALF